MRDRPARILLLAGLGLTLAGAGGGCTRTERALQQFLERHWRAPIAPPGPPPVGLGPVGSPLPPAVARRHAAVLHAARAASPQRRDAHARLSPIRVLQGLSSISRQRVRAQREAPPEHLRRVEGGTRCDEQRGVSGLPHARSPAPV